MISSSQGLGLDYGAIWSTVKQAGADLIMKDLPAAAEKAVVARATAVAAPVVQQAAQAKAKAAYSKGNVALMAGAGVLIGALVAGGGVPRRALGGLIIGSLGALAGFKIGLLTD